MEKIWAPWRKAYIRPKKKRRSGCLFCRLLASSNDRAHYIIKRTSKSFSILNIFPYNNGHMMILPKRHVDSLAKLTNREKLDLLDLCDSMVNALKRALKPQGFNLGVNMGKAAGAGIPKHFHLHIVPRWSGDTNFMPIVGDTKIISESLESVYDQLLKSSPNMKAGKFR